MSARARQPKVRRGYVRTESEEAFQTAVVNLAKFCGWRVYHPPDNRPSRNTGRVQDVEPGYPDLTMVRGPRLVFAELKAENGRVRPEQTEWLDALRAVAAAATVCAGAELVSPIEVYLWRPSDWSEIERILQR